MLMLMPKLVVEDGSHMMICIPCLIGYLVN